MQEQCGFGLWLSSPLNQTALKIPEKLWVDVMTAEHINLYLKLKPFEHSCLLLENRKDTSLKCHINPCSLACVPNY